MNLFLLDSIDTDPRFCFTNTNFPFSVALSSGAPAAPMIARLKLDLIDFQLDEDRGGLELPDYVSNTKNMLFLRRAYAEAITAGFVIGEHEIWPVRLINSKSRLHSDDYVILNPLGRLDCLDRANSDMTPGVTLPMVNPWGKWCLSSKLVPLDRDLFRVLGVVGYFFSERLMSFSMTQRFTNLRFRPVTVF